MADARDPLDRPLPPDDPFLAELRLWLAPRANPAHDPRPAANGDLDEAAVERVHAFLRQLI